MLYTRRKFYARYIFQIRWRRIRRRSIAVLQVRFYIRDAFTFLASCILMYISDTKDDRMGPPLNVRVQATVQGYLVTWEPPAYGKEQVRLYAVRWFRGPSEQLYGRAETTDTYYLGNSLYIYIYIFRDARSIRSVTRVIGRSFTLLQLKRWRRRVTTRSRLPLCLSRTTWQRAIASVSKYRRTVETERFRWA